VSFYILTSFRFSQGKVVFPYICKHFGAHEEQSPYWGWQTGFDLTGQTRTQPKFLGMGKAQIRFRSNSG